MNKNVENNLYNKCNIAQISILDSHCPGPKQEEGKRNSSLFLPPPPFFFIFAIGNAFR